MTDLVMIGYGEHARVVADAATAFVLAGYIDRASGVTTPPYLGTDDVYLAAFKPRDDVRFILGLGAVGVSSARSRLATRYEHAGARFAAIVHPRACVSSSATIAEGAVVLAGAIVNSGARIGAHVVVNTGAIVEHDVVLEPHVSIAPGVVIGGGTTIAEGAFVGLGARIRDHITIGAGAVIAMGAVVVASVPAGLGVAGVPARAFRTRDRT